MDPRTRVQCLDKTGRAFEVEECPNHAGHFICEMYDGFSHMAISQGLPPSNQHIRRRWVETLVEIGVNFVAWRDGRIIGHSAIIPDFDRRDAEFIIFVGEAHRSRGLGVALTEAALEKSKTLALDRVWLTVESFNFRAIKLYLKVGFLFLDEGEMERTMVRRL